MGGSRRGELDAAIIILGACSPTALIYIAVALRFPKQQSHCVRKQLPLSLSMYPFLDLAYWLGAA
jgi:hypothetical protein